MKLLRIALAFIFTSSFAYTYSQQTVTFKAKEGVEVLYNGNPVKEIVLVDDQKKDITVLQIGSIKFNLIIRRLLINHRLSVRL